MGYTTEFVGAIKLSRKLTMAEAKELLEIAEGGSEKSESVTGIDAYFQWVPANTLEHIVWDGEEKFYKYAEQLDWLCKWLAARHISANGSLDWQGEEVGDTGILDVVNNQVMVKPKAKPRRDTPSPLTLDGLRALALDQVTASDDAM